MPTGTAPEIDQRSRPIAEPVPEPRPVTGLFPDGTVPMALEHTRVFDRDARESGRDWSSEADRMIGWKRLSSLEECVATVLGRRKRWVADSFERLPEPDWDRDPADWNDRHAGFNSYLGVALETVPANFEKYGLPDSQVCFLKGWFKDSLPGDFRQCHGITEEIVPIDWTGAFWQRK